LRPNLSHVQGLTVRLKARAQVSGNSCLVRLCNKTSVQYYLVISNCQRFTKELKDQKDQKDLKDQKDQRGSEGSERIRRIRKDQKDQKGSEGSKGLEGSEGSEFSFQLVLHSPNPLRLCHHYCIFYSIYKNCGNSTS
jgi:hypothetical protein